MKEPKSKLPWKVYRYNDRDKSIIDASGDRSIPVTEDITGEDAEYIVEACNNYPEAIRLLDEVMGWHNSVPNEIREEVRIFLERINNEFKTD
jgi:hypothetical protein